MTLRDLRANAPLPLATAAAGTAAAVLTGSTAVTVGAAAAAALAAGLLGAGGLRAPAPPKAKRRAATSPLPRGEGLGFGAGRALLEELPLGVLLVDAESRVQYINPAARELFGQHTAGSFPAASLRAPKLLRAIEEIGASGESQTVELSIMRGGEMRLRAQVRILGPDPKGMQRRRPVVAVIEDITRDWRAQDLYRDFVANASHELKTPLASIIGSIETLEGHAREDPAAARRFLGLMATQAQRMKRLVEDMLSLSRIEQNERVMPRTALDLREVLSETLDLMRPIAKAAEVTLEAALPPPELTVLGSREELAQVFQNLIENAVKYARPGDRVTVESERVPEQGDVRIAVRDTGPGIARTHLPRLTERFYRVSAPSSRAKGGTGLGLAIVKHVLTRHRGQLLIESEEGAGSCFTVVLPTAPASALEPAGMS